MAKFKIIEKSRFIAPKELKEMQGGAVTLCDALQPYKSCGILGIIYDTCGPGVAGYVNGPGGETCVGSGIQFKTSNCSGLSWFSTTCGGTILYTN